MSDTYNKEFIEFFGDKPQCTEEAMEMIRLYLGAEKDQTEETKAWLCSLYGFSRIQFETLKYYAAKEAILKYVDACSTAATDAELEKCWDEAGIANPERFWLRQAAHNLLNFIKRENKYHELLRDRFTVDDLEADAEHPYPPDDLNEILAADEEVSDDESGEGILA